MRPLSRRTCCAGLKVTFWPNTTWRRVLTENPRTTHCMLIFRGSYSWRCTMCWCVIILCSYYYYHLLFIIITTDNNNKLHNLGHYLITYIFNIIQRWVVCIVLFCVLFLKSVFICLFLFRFKWVKIARFLIFESLFFLSNLFVSL